MPNNRYYANLGAIRLFASVAVECKSKAKKKIDKFVHTAFDIQANNITPNTHAVRESNNLFSYRCLLTWKPITGIDALGAHFVCLLIKDTRTCLSILAAVFFYEFN